MDPVKPVAENPQPINEVPTAPAVPNQAPKPEVKSSGNKMTVIAMALFVISILGVVAFLYYQNQQLKAMITSYQTLPSSTPIVTPYSIPTIEPTVTGSATSSPVATSSATPTTSPSPLPTN